MTLSFFLRIELAVAVLGQVPDHLVAAADALAAAAEAAALATAAEDVVVVATAGEGPWPG